ncbi:TolC family outer membrane protein [Alcaligenaceae bacterium]|nr:TolC family outer membrane protein [Alcaligenaceae bacterium]
MFFSARFLPALNRSSRVAAALLLGGACVHAAWAQDGKQAEKPAQPGWNLETLQSLHKQEPADGGASLVVMSPSARVPALEGLVDLARAWRLALEHDPTYQAAISEQAASDTERAQGRAALLPQVQAGYSRSRISGSVEQPNFRGQRVSSDVRYDSSNAYVQLQQPLLNYSRYAEYQRGQARAGEGEAVFAVRQQEAGTRLATAYLNVLLADDRLALQRELEKSLDEQARAQESLYVQNEGTRTDAQETRARLARTRADVIAAQDQLRTANRELQALLGATPQALAPAKRDFPLPPLVPADLSIWLERARVNNAEVKAAREAVKVADTEVSRAASRYFPSMDLVASLSKAESENLSTLSQRSNTFLVGINVNIPIFTGGYNTANTARARADRSRLEQELRAATERALAETTRQYSAVLSGEQRIRALEAAVESSRLSLDAARKGYDYGIASNVDVLKVQDKLFQALSDLSRARLEYVLARLSLAAAVGDLQASEFDAVNQVFFEG